jgi:hypothetical protein
LQLKFLDPNKGKQDHSVSSQQFREGKRKNEREERREERRGEERRGEERRGDTSKILYCDRTTENVDSGEPSLHVFIFSPKLTANIKNS